MSWDGLITVEQERKKMYKTVYTEVEVDVDLGDFDTEDLVEELESRIWKQYFFFKYIEASQWPWENKYW